MGVRKLQLIEGGTSSPAAGRPDARGPLVRVAIASQDGKRLDAHFGFARRLMVFDVSRRTHRLVQAIVCPSDDTEPERAESDDRVGPKVAALAGCHLLYVLAIGPPAAARVIRADIHPIKVEAPEPVEAVIARVQTMLRGEPPAWLRRIVTENERRR
jgi:nitrogen fixation protein NifX